LSISARLSAIRSRLSTLSFQHSAITFFRDWQGPRFTADADRRRLRALEGLLIPPRVRRKGLPYPRADANGGLRSPT
jgi:hypothetical protein